MKTVQSILLLALVAMLSSSCVSRTVSSKDGYGGDTENKSIIWIWQEEYRNTK